MKSYKKAVSFFAWASTVLLGVLLVGMFLCGGIYYAYRDLVGGYSWNLPLWCRLCGAFTGSIAPCFGMAILIISGVLHMWVVFIDEEEK